MSLRLRSLISTAVRVKTVFRNVPMVTPIRMSHHEGPPPPFSNLPFSIHSRYTATLVFSLLFGIGLWAPFLIVWYKMAKRVL